MARTPVNTKAVVTDTEITQCLAAAVSAGDIVNFRFLFISYSPLRQDSTEDIHSPRYAYLLPDGENTPAYREALALAQRPDILAHLRAQLERNGPPQLPWEPLMLLADNAVRVGKYTTAAQAYELLRIRRRVQDEFLRQADMALDAGNLRCGVHGYIIATGLDYDYAAFPEPLPAVPNYQERALILHGEYPARPEDALPLLPEEEHVRQGLNFLLQNVEIAGRLDAHPLDQRVAFLAEWVRQTDPDWPVFQKRYQEACALAREYGRMLEAAGQVAGNNALAAEVAAAQEQANPRRIPATLAGRANVEMDWWQYLKDLADQHPAGALFIARQVTGKDREILLPRHRADHRLVGLLGLAQP